jgi:hypothetical protein
MSCHGVLIRLALMSETNWTRSVSRYACMASRMNHLFRFGEVEFSSCGRSGQEDVAISQLATHTTFITPIRHHTLFTYVKDTTENHIIHKRGGQGIVIKLDHPWSVSRTRTAPSLVSEVAQQVLMGSLNRLTLGFFSEVLPVASASPGWLT